MITLQADFNHIDTHGRLRLDDLRMHRQTPFAQIAARHEAILFVERQGKKRYFFFMGTEPNEAGGTRTGVRARLTVGATGPMPREPSLHFPRPYTEPSVVTNSVHGALCRLNTGQACSTLSR